MSLTGITAGFSGWTSSTGVNSIIANNETGNLASGDYAIAEGQGTQAIGLQSHSEGFYTLASGNTSHVEGDGSVAYAESSHAEGSSSFSYGFVSHAEGFSTQSIGFYSHSEGYTTVASGTTAHAEGDSTRANGTGSHSEGGATISNGLYSHAEGYISNSNGDFSHAGGAHSIANGQTSFVHGSGSTSNGINTVVFGLNITGNTDNTVYTPNARLAETAGTVIYSAGTDLYNIFSSTGSQIYGLKNFIPSGTTVDVAVNYQYFVYGNLTIEGTLNNAGQIVVMNGAAITSGGTLNLISGGSISLVSSQSINKYIISTGLTANTPLVVYHNLGTTDVMLSAKDLNTGNKIILSEYNYNLNNITVESTQTLSSIKITIIG